MSWMSNLDGTVDVGGISLSLSPLLMLLVAWSGLVPYPSCWSVRAAPPKQYCDFA